MKRNTIHYGWIVLLTGTMGVFGALGLARFGYTTILPTMQENLGINNEQAGLLATFNLIGYLVMSILGGMLAVKYGARKTASLGLALAAAGMILTGLARGLGSLLIWRLVTGLGSGAANVSVMGLWPAWFSSRKRGLASGIAVSGSSIALIFTGLAVPRIIDRYGDGAWRHCWLVYGFITLFLSVCTYVIIRNNASDVGLVPIGGDGGVQEASRDKNAPVRWKKVYLSMPVWFLGLIYSAFGFSYIIYMTFFVKYLVSEHGYSNAAAGNLFMAMGWLSLFCGLAWGAISDRIGRKQALVILYLFNSVSFALFALGTNTFHLAVSAVIFGLSAWSIPAIMAAACGDMLERELAPAALGFITLFFGIGQAFGPAAAGAMADASGSFPAAFILASAVSLAGAAGSFLAVNKKAWGKTGYRV